MRLGVIADTRHHLDDHGRLCTLEPVAAQLEEWAALFDHLVLAVPLHPGPPPRGFRPYRCDNVSLVALRPGGGHGVAAKAALALRIPGWLVGMARAVRQVDALHLRCPCNIALLGIGAAVVSGRKRYAMYAGNWDGYSGEPVSYRLQRWLLSRRRFGGPVTVYTESQPVSPHIVPFFSPTFSLADWEAEEPVVAAKLGRLRQGPRVQGPVQLLSVGHLEPNKNHAVVVEAVRLLRDGGLDARLDVLGDGELFAQLAGQVSRLGLDEAVCLHGRQPLDVVKQHYRTADFNVLASKTEGYPKVLAEGMVAGAVPITSRFPMSEALTGHGTRGVSFNADRPQDLAATVRELLGSADRLAGMIVAGRDYTRTVTLDAFRAQVEDLLRTHWGDTFLGRTTAREGA